MDKQLFVQNIKMYCQLRGVKPTVACRESGAGVNLINKLETRGSIPSVEKVQLLAQYLKVTTSELLGEERKPEKGILGETELRLVALYRGLNLEGREKLLDYADDLSASGKYIKTSADRLGKKA